MEDKLSILIKNKIKEWRKDFFYALIFLAILALLAVAGYCKIETTKNMADFYEMIGL